MTQTFIVIVAIMSFALGVIVGQVWQVVWSRSRRPQLPRCNVVALGVQRRCEYRPEGHSGPHMLHDQNGNEIYFEEGDWLEEYRR